MRKVSKTCVGALQICTTSYVSAQFASHALRAERVTWGWRFTWCTLRPL